MAEASTTNNLKGSILPEDIMVEILSRLPVKILTKFKCVCTSWYTILSNPSPPFISKHLQNSYNNKTNDHGRLLLRYSTMQDGRRSAVLFSDPTLSTLDYQPFDIFSFETNKVFRPLLAKNNFLGPYNGIFFLDMYALWNPATKEYKLLPVPPLAVLKDPEEYIIEEIQAFGLNPLISEDYKVVLIRQFIGPTDYPSQVLVYSANENSWVSFDFPWRYSVVEGSCYMYLNGVYYWMACEYVQGGNKYVISFDMGNNSFQRVISAPTSGIVLINSRIVLYRDSIGWVSFNDDNDNFFHMWVMDQEGDFKVWTKQFTIGPLLERHYPIGYWKNDQLVMQSVFGETLLFDPACGLQGIKNLGLHIDLYFCSFVLIYKESLVSIKGETYVPGETPLSLQECVQAIREYGDKHNVFTRL